MLLSNDNLYELLSLAIVFEDQVEKTHLAGEIHHREVKGTPSEDSLGKFEYLDR